VALVAVVYLGQMTTTWDGQHIRVTFITERLSIATARWLRIAVAFVCSGLLVWMIVATTTKAVTATEAGEYRFGLIPIPVWPARILIPVGLFAMLLLIILQLIQLVAKRTSVPGLLVDGMVESEGAVVPTVSTDVREQKEGSL
jgi:TRAP-type C4-dicarboxylate transport system permease small subunit